MSKYEEGDVVEVRAFGRWNPGVVKRVRRRRLVVFYTDPEGNRRAVLVDPEPIRHVVLNEKKGDEP